MEKNNNLKVIKQSDANYMQVLEVAITYGQPVLIENVGESCLYRKYAELLLIPHICIFQVRNSIRT